MKIMKWRVAFWAASLAWCSGAVWAAGLSTTFSSVLVNDVQTGTSRSIDGPEGQGLVIKNLDTTPQRVRVRPLKPTAAQLKAGAQPLPDLSWLRITPETVDVPPQGRVSVRIQVLVPSDLAYRGQLYQVMLWSQGQPLAEKGMSYNAALLSTLRIRTRP